MAYLTRWRLTLAAGLLREPESTVASVARPVGYGGAFALSEAFKRVRGVEPAGVPPGVRARGGTGPRRRRWCPGRGASPRAVRVRPRTPRAGTPWGNPARPS
ncbi:hypothetical protein ACF06N_11185 [Streptomyces albidoflavus]